MASPTPNKIYKDENEMIGPAREGVLRVLRVARDAGVKRVVLTSAFGAIGVGHKNHKGPYTEKDWSNTDAKIHPYQKSKTLAEKAAWEFIQQEGSGLELATVNPVGVMGPILGNDYSHSNDIVRQMLEGKLKAVPKIYSDYVDVRDVAELHILAMTRPEANGERFIASSAENLSTLKIANILRKHLGKAICDESVRFSAEGSIIFLLNHRIIEGFAYDLLKDMKYLRSGTAFRIMGMGIRRSVREVISEKGKLS
ncbi:NAD-dependent epimerase/dehydratase family protein [Paenibacillus macerans]|uniref:NAD-dependent epimerase/dehydratase family protein n=1 Tax=Paenibacillus macerans TaxID=44252 RepID=UPI003D30F05F